MTNIGFRPTAPINVASVFNAPAIIQKVLDVQNRHMQQIVSKGSVYPPPPPPTGKRQYKRTGTLGRSWHITPAHVSGDTISGSVVNTATDKRGRHYASRVFGSTVYPQAPIHQGRWPDRSQLFDRAAYLADIRAAVNGG